MGPLQGVKIVELAGIGPGPFAGMLLSDMGADIVRVDRAGQVNPGVVRQAEPRAALPRAAARSASTSRTPRASSSCSGSSSRPTRSSRATGPASPSGSGSVPTTASPATPKLVYGRMTGWGQDGPMAQAAGHDINYIALAGALAHFGRAGSKPTPPINLVGDFGGGGMFMAFGLVCGILEAQRSGKGQVIDVAMVDGTAALMTMMWGLKQIGFWDEAMGNNVLDTGAPFYDTYETADGKFVSLGSLEPQFYAELIQRLGLESETSRADGSRRLGHAARRGSPRCSRPRRATSGTRSSPAATRATRRCSRCRKRRTTSTSRRATRSSSATVFRSRRPRRASRAPSPRCERSAPVAGPAHRRSARRLGRRRRRGRQAARQRARSPEGAR